MHLQSSTSSSPIGSYSSIYSKSQSRLCPPSGGTRLLGTRAYPVPTLFGNLRTCEFTGEQSKWISLLPCAGHHFDWIRYFSVLPQSRESTSRQGIQVPSSALLRRKRKHDLLGEIVCAVQRHGTREPCLTLTVHISLFVRDLEPILKSSHPNGLSLYLNHHELRRRQGSNPMYWSHMGNFAILPSIIVKVCNGFQTKCETIGKYVPLRMEKKKQTDSDIYVPSPLLKKSARTSNGCSHADGTPSRIRSTVHLCPKSNFTSDERITCPASMSRSFDKPAASRLSSSGSSELLDTSETTQATCYKMSHDIDSTLHPAIRLIVQEALRVYPDDIDAAFNTVHRSVTQLMSEGKLDLKNFSDEVIQQSIWRGLEDMCCGGSMGSGGTIEEANLDSYEEPMPKLLRQRHFSLPSNEENFEEAIQVADAQQYVPSLHWPPLTREEPGSVRVEQRDSARLPATQTTITHKEEEVVRMHSSEKVLNRSSVEISTLEATGLIAHFTRLRERAVSSDLLPEAFDEWMIFIPKPVVLSDAARQLIKQFREQLLLELQGQMDRFVIATHRDALISRIASFIRERFVSLQGSPCKGETVIPTHLLAREIVGTALLQNIGLKSDDLETMTFESLQAFMKCNLGLVFEADVDAHQNVEAKSVSSQWKSNIELLSHFTWFTTETELRLPKQEVLSFKILKPQLFRCPQFSNSLLAKHHLFTAWDAIPCSQRKVLNEQMIEILDNTVTFLKNTCDLTALKITLHNGARNWASLFKQIEVLNQITDVEWDILFIDTILDGIYYSAIEQLWELR